MEDQAEIDRKEKQMYLKSEIVEGGYDVDMFVEYMDKIRENGMIFLLNSSLRWYRRRCLDYGRAQTGNPLFVSQF
jgi:hypothetical protein